MNNEKESEVAPARDRLSTDIGGVDGVLEGRPLAGRNTLVRGPPGAGKALFGGHLLARLITGCREVLPAANGTGEVDAPEELRIRPEPDSLRQLVDPGVARFEIGGVECVEE